MAVNPRAVARALPASKPAAQGSWGAPGTTTGTTSPVLATYDAWMSGRAYGTGLPRDAAAFLQEVTFGPMSPIEPIGINAPDPDSGRPEPRRFDYPVGWNMPTGQPGSEGLKLATFQQLRTIADAYSVARACIRTRIQEILGLEWDITPTKAAEKKMRGDKEARREFDERRAKVLSFWNRPDPGKYHDFVAWFHAVLEDVFVVDALSLYIQPTRMKGKGVLGSDLGALCHIAGDTVRPMLDALGGRPAPPNPAYQVYDYGVPRVDLMTALTGDDVAEMGEALAAEYRGDQLLYLPYFSRSWTPYGFPHLEQALVPIMTGIARQQFQLSYFSEGSVPGMFISAGDANATPSQLRELQDALNAMAGDPAWKHKIIVLPQGSDTAPMRGVELAGLLDELIMTQVCMTYDIMPMELGIAPKISQTQSSGAANQMAKASQDINQRKALRPMLKWLKQSIFDFVIQNIIGQQDMQWNWACLDEGVDEQALVDQLGAEVAKGMLSIDEARTERGRQPWGLPMTSDPVYMTATGLVPIGAIDPESGKTKGDMALAQQIADGKTNPPPGQPGTPAHAGAAAQGTGSAEGGKKPTQAANGNPGGGAAKPAARPAEAGQGKTPAKPAPAPAKKVAALAELDLIRRRLSKGGSLDGWVAEDVPQEVFTALRADLASGLGADLAVAKARGRVRVSRRRARRLAATSDAEEGVRAGLDHLVAGLQAGTVATAEFVHAATQVMFEGIHAGLKAGARHALEDLGQPTTLVKAGGDEEDDDEEDDATGDFAAVLAGIADRRADEQHGYLQGLMKSALAGAALGSRVGMYAGQVNSAYEEGYGVTYWAVEPEATVTWYCTSSDPCKLCKARDGKTYSTEGLPGWPGDGGPGGLCMGGAHCRCELEFSNGAGGARGINTLRDSPMHAQVLAEQAAQRERLADVTAARQGFVDSLPAGPRERAAARDAIRADLARERGGWPSDVPAADVAARIPGHLKTVDDDGTPTPLTGQVYAYLAENYPPEVLDWVWETDWRGPELVALTEIDMDNRPGGERDPAKVSAIARAINDGAVMDPIVVVELPDGGLLEIADGWHRTEGGAEAGLQAMQAYIGSPPYASGPWQDAMHRAKLNV